MGPVLIIRGSTGHDTGVQMAKAAAVVYEAKMDKISSIHEAIKSSPGCHRIIKIVLHNIFRA